MAPKRISIFKNVIQGVEPPKDTEKEKPTGENEHVEGECDVLVTKGRETCKMAGRVEQL